jgi:AraC-like DNA-binding protein
VLFRRKVRISMFWQFTVMHLAICCFIMASLAPILGRAVQRSRQGYLAEAQRTLDQSSTIFQKSAEEMLLLPKKKNAFQQYLTITGRCSGDSAIAGALFKESELFRLFNLPTLPVNSFLAITNAFGDLIYAYQYQPGSPPAEGYFLLSTQIAMTLCTAILGIPNGYFKELYAPLVQMIFYTILIAVLCGALFAAFNHLPIRRLERLDGQLGPQGGWAAARASGRFSGPDLQAVFCHTQFNLMQAGRGFFPAQDAPFADKAPALNLMEARQLYKLVMACRTEEINRYFDQLQQMLGTGAISPGEEGTQAFYLLRMALEMAADARLPEFLLTGYDQSKPTNELFEGLRQDALALAEKLVSRQKSAGSKAKANVMAYIQQNFQSPDVYANSIAEIFHMSRSAVYSLVREQTGQSLNEYLEALRVGEALWLLKATEMTVAEIAAACGYNSANTFYKVFKKRFGLSPSAFRG